MVYVSTDGVVLRLFFFVFGKLLKIRPLFERDQIVCKHLQVVCLLNIEFVWILRALLDKNKGFSVHKNYWVTCIHNIWRSVNTHFVLPIHLPRRTTHISSRLWGWFFGYAPQCNYQYQQLWYPSGSNLQTFLIPAPVATVWYNSNN